MEEMERSEQGREMEKDRGEERKGRKKWREGEGKVGDGKEEGREREEIVNGKGS